MKKFLYLLIALPALSFASSGSNPGGGCNIQYSVNASSVIINQVGVSVSSPLSGDGSSSNPIKIATATAISTGVVTAVDWNTFNNKLSTAQTDLLYISISTGTNGTGQLLRLTGAGLIPNSLQDSSSVTLQGQGPFILVSTGTNSAGQLVRLSSSTLIPNNLIDGSSITKQGLLIAGTNITFTPGAGSLTITAAGSAPPVPLTVTKAYVILSTDTIVLATNTAAGYTLTLPTSPPSGETHRIKKLDRRKGIVTISGAQKIDDQTNTILFTPTSSIDLIYDGTQWRAF